MAPSPLVDDRRSLRWLLLAATTLLLLLVARFWFLTDDAYISFRYARNLAEGHGLVWNPGASDPVEGYSNLGWVLLLALTQQLGLSPELVSRVLGTASGVLLVALVLRVLVRRGSPPAAVAAGTLFLASLPPVAVWCSGGLATLPFALSLFGLFERLSRTDSQGRAQPALVGAALWAATAVLLRADGAAWALLVVAPTVFTLATRRGAALVTVGGTIVLVTAAVLVFRWSTYGDWLPNTARAKLSWSELEGDLRAQFLRRGVFYVVSLLLAVPSLLVAAVAGARGLRRAPAAWAIALGSAAYAVAVGGDFMAMGRFVVPGLAFVAVLCAEGVRALPIRAGAAVAALLVALNLAAAFDLSPFPRALRDRFHFRWNSPDEAVSEVDMWRRMSGRTAAMVQLGRALALHTTSEERATYGPVGAVGYHSRHTIHDTYGLTSRYLLERSRMPPSLRSPGHDRVVPPEVLNTLDLTYYEASIVPAAAPRRPLPEGAPVRWEEIPLDPADGFPADHVLRLLRPR